MILFYVNFVTELVNMKKLVLLALLVCVTINLVSAQEVYKSSGKTAYSKKKRKKGYDPEKLVLGGGFDAAYSSGYAVAGVSPMVGYRFLKPLVAGVGLGYLYYQAPSPFYNRYDRQHIIYPNVWTRVFFFRNFYLSGSFEYDIIKARLASFDSWGNPTVLKGTFDSKCLLFGLGIKQMIGGRVSFYLELAHEFLNDPLSPYLSQPLVFRAGIGVGL
jgi:hypothetical protein